MSDDNNKSGAVLVTQAPEEVLDQARDLERAIAEDEQTLAEIKARGSAVTKNIVENTLKLRKLLRSADTPLPLFDAGSASSADEAAQ